MDICELILTSAPFRLVWGIDVCTMMAIEGTTKPDAQTSNKIKELNKTWFPEEGMCIKAFMKDKKKERAGINFTVPDGFL